MAGDIDRRDGSQRRRCADVAKRRDSSSRRAIRPLGRRLPRRAGLRQRLDCDAARRSAPGAAGATPWRPRRRVACLGLRQGLRPRAGRRRHPGRPRRALRYGARRPRGQRTVLADLGAEELEAILEGWSRAARRLGRRPSFIAGRSVSRYSYIRDGAQIYQRSFAIIRAESDLARFTAEEEPSRCASSMLRPGRGGRRSRLLPGPRRVRPRRALGRRARRSSAIPRWSRTA